MYTTYLFLLLVFIYLLRNLPADCRNVMQNNGFILLKYYYIFLNNDNENFLFNLILFCAHLLCIHAHPKTNHLFAFVFEDKLKNIVVHCLKKLLQPKKEFSPVTVDFMLNKIYYLTELVYSSENIFHRVCLICLHYSFIAFVFVIFV